MWKGVMRMSFAFAVGLVMAAVSPDVFAYSGDQKLEKPVGLDAVAWSSLEAAIATSISHRSKLVGGQSSFGNDGAAGDNFGLSIAVDGDTVLVGAFNDDIGAIADQGSAYVFTRSGTSWSLQAKLTAQDGAEGDLFGSSVDLVGDTAVVGAYSANVGLNEGQGAAYVFTRKGTAWAQQAKLTAMDGEAGDSLGFSLALDVETVLVGASGDDIGAVANQGSVYVFSRSGTTWSQEAQFTADDGTTNDYFGTSVALAGDTALVGSYFDDVGANGDQGSVTVFTRSGAVWGQQARLVAADGASGDAFGFLVVIQGETVLVGAPHDNISRGSVYVFTRSGATWSQQARLETPTAGDGRFGFSVALDGDTALVGAPFEYLGVNRAQGSAYVFVRDGGAWVEQRKLTASDAEAGDEFGYSVALAHGTVLVGSRRDDVGTQFDQGSAYAFTRSGTIWGEQAQLTAGGGAANEFFGFSVAVDGDTALVGAPRDDIGANREQGSVYVFIRSGDSWIQQDWLTASDGAAGDAFGFSVAFKGDTAVVGAPSADVGAHTEQGAVYVFNRNGSAWNQLTKLTANDGSVSDSFGISVALNGDTALFGAYLAGIGDEADHGAAYVFNRTGTVWAQQAKLEAKDASAFSHFGRAVALDGDTALVGADEDTDTVDKQGSAYVFARTGTSWTQQAKLTAGDAGYNDRFGWAVALAGNTALVGVYQDEQAYAAGGSAYVFTRIGSTWTQQAQLTAGDNPRRDYFGFSVALDGDTALVGAASRRGVGSESEQDSAYVFGRIGTNWTEKARLTAGARHSSLSIGFFGYPVAVAGDIALVGSPGDDGEAPYGNPDEGSVYAISFKRTQTLSFGALENKLHNDPSFSVAASGGGSGQAVVFESRTAAVCTTAGTNGSLVTLTGELGICTIRATQAGDDNYNAATPVDRSFEVLALNEPPTISLPSMFTMHEDSSGSVTFAVGDDFSSADELNIQATSSSASLIDDGALAAGLSRSSGADRTLTFLPNSNANGAALITLTVTDGRGVSSQAQLTLVVIAVNDRPSAGYGPNRVWPTGESGAKSATGLVGVVSAGPFNESDQAVNVEMVVESDPTGVLGAVALDAAGDLTYTLTGNSGAARLRLQPVDDGGTDNGGVDRGEAIARHIIVGDGVDISLSVRREQPIVKHLVEALTNGSALANYTIEVRNNSAQIANGLRLRVSPIIGLAALLWSCQSHPCTPPNGSGGIDTVVNLPGDGVLRVDLSGTVSTSAPFVEITARATLPAGTTVLLPGDDAQAFIEPGGASGVHKSGFE